MPLEQDALSQSPPDTSRWLAWYRGLIAGLTGITVSLLAYFGSVTLDELKTIRTQQIAFGQSLAVAASHGDESRQQIDKLWSKSAASDAKLTDLDRRTTLLEYRVGRR